MRRICVFVAGLALVGCRATPTAPTADAGNGISSAFVLSGSVTDSITRPLAGASVTVVNGSQSGISTATDENGLFAMPMRVRDAVQVQFAEDGYLPLVISLQPAPVGRGGLTAVTLYLRATPVSLAGTYLASFAADPSCSQIPDAFRTRSYTATIEQPGDAPRNTRLEVTLSGAAFAQGASRMILNTFYGFVKDDIVDLRVENLTATLSDWTEGISEQVTPGVFVSVYGRATPFTVRDPSSLTASLSGDFQYADPAGLKTCTASNHQIRFKRSS